MGTTENQIFKDNNEIKNNQKVPFEKELDNLSNLVDCHKTWFSKHGILYTTKLASCTRKWIEILTNEDLDNFLNSHTTNSSSMELKEILTSINIMVDILSELLNEINSLEVTKKVRGRLFEILYSNNMTDIELCNEEQSQISSIILAIFQRILQLKSITSCENYLAQVLGVVDSIMLSQKTTQLLRNRNFLLTEVFSYYQSGGFIFMETLLALFRNSNLEATSNSSLDNNTLISRLNKLLSIIWAELRKQNDLKIVKTPKIQEAVEEIDLVCELLLEYSPYSDEIEILVQMVKANLFARHF